MSRLQCQLAPFVIFLMATFCPVSTFSAELHNRREIGWTSKIAFAPDNAVGAVSDRLNQFELDINVKASAWIDT